MYTKNPAYTSRFYIWIFYSLSDVKFYYIIITIIFLTILLFLIIINSAVRFDSIAQVYY